MQVQDQELEKGRRNDDLSSRESTPQPRQRRAITPTSDDDSAFQPIADDDTPPPQDRPLIRQAVAFAAVGTPPTINTYEAATTQPNANTFLPGQEVPQLLPLPKKRGPSKRSEGSKKVKHFNDAFASQTSRWRAKVYDPTPSSAPPTFAGDGPYNSLFRAPVTPAPQVVSAVATPSQVQDTIRAQPSSSSRVSVVDSASNSARKGRGTRKSAKNKAPESPGASNNLSNASMPVGAAPPVSSSQVTSFSGHGSFGVPVDSLAHPETSANVHIQVQQHHTAVSAERQNFANESDYNRDSRSQLPNHQIETDGQKRARSLAVLTVLIQDERSGRPDYQLAEVRVPLKRAERVEDGWWADSKDVCEKLQAGPSRIDGISYLLLSLRSRLEFFPGPAKVYTLRGKFRQFFLRVSADNKDEWGSANVVVSAQRTLDVFVEEPLPLGYYSQYPLRTSQHYGGSLSPKGQQSESPPRSSRGITDGRDSARSSDASQGYHDFHKRRRSPSYEEYHDQSPAPPSPYSRSTGSPSRRNEAQGYRPSAVPPKRQRHYGKGSLDHIMIDPIDDSEDEPMPPPPPRGFHTPTSDADEDEIHEMISKSISPLLEQDPSWADFFQWKAMPQTASIVLKQYQWVKRMMNEWAGKTAPLESRSFQVGETHVLAALRLDDEWGMLCKETLRLLGLYGPEGKHLQDPRVNSILEDNSLPGYNAKPIKRLLHLLRHIDEEYLKERLDGNAQPGKDADIGPSITH